MKDLGRFLNLFLVLASLFICNTSFALLNTPSITSPTNNATNVLNKVTVNCNTITGATYYIFEMDSVATFKSGYYKKYKKVIGSAIIFDSLPFNKNHFVRVKAYNANLTDSSAVSATSKFKTYNTISSITKTGSYAMISFSWTANTVNSLQIQIDTSQSFNTKSLMKYNSVNPSIALYSFKYTKSNQIYYYRYRSVYGSKTSDWVNPNGTVGSVIGFVMPISPLNDSFLIEKNIPLNTNYKGDTNVKYTIYIDTVKTFNSANNKKIITSAGTFDLVLKPDKIYYLKMKMVYANDSCFTDSFHKFKTAKNSPSPQILSAGTFRFTVPLGFTLGIIEMDTSPYFNSPMKVKWDTGFTSTGTVRTFTKKYLSIKLYHKLYYRYKVTAPTYELGWHSTYKRFLAPSYSVGLINPPITPFSSTSTFTDFKALMFEVDTSLKFNSKYNIKNYLSATIDSIRTLKFSANYFLRCKHFNSIGDTTDWGNPVSFKTIDTVRITSPNASQYNYNSFNLTAENAPGIKGYNWQLDTLSDFSTAYSIFSLKTSTPSSQIPRMTVNKKYYWRMRLMSSVDTSKWSRTGAFNLVLTGNSLPYPFLIYPSNNSMNISPSNVNFLWKDNTGGIGASYEFYMDSPFTPLSNASVVDNTISIKNLKPNTTYTWYVLSYKKNYTSEIPVSSQQFTFTTSAISDISLLNNNTKLSIYPNPTHSALDVELLSGEKINVISIKSIDGKIVYEQNFVNSNYINIDVSNFTNGTYITSCQSNSGVYVSKFIKE